MAIRVEQSISLALAGDGVTRTVDVDLGHFAFPFTGIPSGVVVTPTEVTGTLNGNVVTLSFDTAPPDFNVKGEIVSILLTLLFPA